MARPDFGIDTKYYEGVPLTCRYIAPGITFHDLAMAFEKAKNEAEPGDELSGNPAKWPTNRGIMAVSNMLLDAIYGPE
jgi:hypothetical protein